jgi:predicted nucleotidyltransferase component of viral defense system
MDKSRNEPRDIYDTWYLIANKYISDIFLLKSYIEEKIKFKKLSESSILKVFDEKEVRYRKLWGVRLKNQMIELPKFDKVYRELQRELKATRQT